jgi:hypothetical protein
MFMKKLLLSFALVLCLIATAESAQAQEWPQRQIRIIVSFGPGGRSDVPQTARSKDSSKQTDLARLTRERDEALEQQAVTAEILRVISSSPTNLQRVFATVAASATRLCDASDAAIQSGRTRHMWSASRRPLS